MELRMAPASPPPAPPKEFRLHSAATSPYATAPSSPHGRQPSPFAAHAAGAPFLTAPPSPNPFDLLSPATPRLAGAAKANPFDRFQHFTSAPASPRRAAAIYAHFAEERGSSDDGDREDDEGGGDEEFQPRGSYATSVPFDWEERPGTPKAGLGGGANGSAAWDDDDADFEFGTFADKAAAQAEELTTADELFEEGKIRPLKPLLRPAADEPAKIRPLKPPPGLLDGGSVASSPRSPMARVAGMLSPRRRSRVGSGGVDFDPFAAALLEATKATSPLGGGKEANAGSGSPPKKQTLRPASRSAGWRKWRLSDLLLFRSSSDAGRVNKETTFKCSPTQQPETKTPVKKVIARIATTAKAGGKGYDYDISKARKQQQGNRSAAAAAEGIAGCARLSPLQRLARGFATYSWHHSRGMAAPDTKG